MIKLARKSQSEIASMRRAGQIVGSVLFDLRVHACPGVTPRELDQLATDLIQARGGQLAFKGYQKFPATICVSVNDAVVHGIPTDEPIQEGDIVGLDAGAIVDGYYADAAITVAIGEVDKEAQRLLHITELALKNAIDRLAPGKPLGDIQAVIQQTIEAANFGIIRDLTGHGIGRVLHEEPQIPNYGRVGTGPLLVPGFTFCLEPMVTLGNPAVYIDDDHWTIRTRDRSLGAQFEHTLVITETGAEILTPIRPWPTA